MDLYSKTEKISAVPALHSVISGRHRSHSLCRGIENVGDTIEYDEILVTVEADKAAYEVPAPSGGKLIEIHAEAGSTINVGDMIAVIQA